MTLKQKRDYISRMEQLKSGFMTPGMLVDQEIDKKIIELDKKFKDVNFGQTITHETFEYFRPKRFAKEDNTAVYRDWKLRQIIADCGWISLQVGQHRQDRQLGRT